MAYEGILPIEYGEQVTGSLTPANITSITVGGAVDDGDHYYKVAYDFGGGIVSTLSAVSAVATAGAGNNTVNLDTIPIGPVTTVNRLLYRTKVGGTDYYLVDTIAGNVTTTYIDVKADATLGAIYAATYEDGLNKTAAGDILIQSGAKILFTTSTVSAISFDDWFDQPVKTTASPTFAAVTTSTIQTSSNHNLALSPNGTGYVAITNQKGIINVLDSLNTGNTFVGTNPASLVAQQSVYGFGNTALGYYTLDAITYGFENTAIGADALTSLTTGQENTAVGMGALSNVTTGMFNNAIGYNAGGTITTGNNNVFVGADSGVSVTGNASSNVFIGHMAGDNASQKADALNSTAIGANSYTTKNNQVVIGDANVTETVLHGDVYDGATLLLDQSVATTASPTFVRETILDSNNSTFLNGKGSSSTGFNNIAIGQYALQNNISGYSNISIGENAMVYNRGGYSNLAFGGSSLCYSYTSNNNVALGFSSLYSLKSGSGNTAVGPNSLYYVNPTGKAISSFADYSGTVAGTVKATSVGHGLPIGTTSNIIINGTTNYNGTYTVTYIDDDNFYFTDTYVTNEIYGYWRKANEGSLNSALGIQSGFSLTTGYRNVFIGYNAGYHASQKVDAINSTAIGSYSYTTKDNQVVIGDADVVETVLRGRVLGNQGADVASANDMTLTVGNYFDITGSVEMQRILGTGWTAGTQVILQFDAAPLVKHGTAAGASYYGFQLAGAADFQASAGDTLTLVFDGAWWREVARTVI